MKNMNARRTFFKKIFRWLAGFGFFFSPLVAIVQNAYAQTKRIILPKGTDLSTLKNKNPATLDTRNLEVIPLNNFQTMGLTDHDVNLASWRLKIDGNVAAPSKLTYSQILELPSIEREVLLICPGVFTNHGRWKGVSLMTLLHLAQMKEDTTHVTVHGPPGNYEKVERFPLADIRSDKVFLAYQVNGEALPRKHGFPLRIVAEDYYGSDWVKYVYKLEAYKNENT
jgi:DMSO/TMAO reductase YedYZ molybdopterin-dependent catalytic subunit